MLLQLWSLRYYSGGKKVVHRVSTLGSNSHDCEKFHFSLMVTAMIALSCRNLVKNSSNFWVIATFLKVNSLFFCRIYGTPPAQQEQLFSQLFY